MKRETKYILLLAGIFALLFFAKLNPLGAQPVSVDRGVQAEGLWCFPLVNDSLTWLYLPDEGMLAMDDQKRPQFSLIRYVDVQENPDADATNSISKAAGGALVHFLVTYGTDEKKIERAHDKLTSIFSNSRIKLKGPVIFQEGRYTLVSSILNPDTNEPEKKVLAVGSAPVLQGSRIALSFELDPIRSKLFLESLQMPTPDVSIVFDMTFTGLTDAYRAKITVNWAEMEKGNYLHTGGSLYFLSGEIEKAFEEMRRDGAVKIETEGEDDRMQQIVDAAYAKIVDMLFRKVEPAQEPAEQQDPITALLGDLFGGGKGAGGTGKLYGFSAFAVYKKKNISHSGTAELNFNSRSTVNRHYFITFNIGGFYKTYGENPDYIRTVSLSDPDFQQRDISVGVDGFLLPEFDKFINGVTVTLRKNHQGGSTTIRELKILKGTLDNGKPLVMSYGSFGDTDRLAWLNYEYRAQFIFLGGRSWETGWRKQNAAMINLQTPYERRVVRLEADPDTLKAKNVRATTVKVEYPFFDGMKSMEKTVFPADDLSKMQFDLLLPEGQYAYKYTLRWRLKDGTEKVVKGETEMGILFIDAVPDN